MIKRIFSAGLRTGAVLSGITTIAVMAAAQHETGAPWAPINAICHVIDGDDVSQPAGFSRRESTLGMGLNASAMMSWGVLYEAVLMVTRKNSGPASAIGAAVAAYVIDYKILPPRLSPGIEKKLSGPSIFFAYAALAATLALSPLWNDYDENRNTDGESPR